MPAQVFTIPAGLPFADTLARGLVLRLNADGDPLALSRAVIYLPTRRATRTLADAFAHVLGGAALLPEIRALGDVDEDEFLFDPAVEDLDLPPVIAPVREQLLLATLVQRWDSAQRDGTLTFAQAAGLAGALAAFLREAETQGADLANLEMLVPADLASHWTEVKDFLSLLRDQWPALLKAEAVVGAATRRNAALAALARRFETSPPNGPMIAAGSTGSIPATAELLRVIANLPQGSVILPGLDRELDNGAWDQIDASHPQCGMKQLLARIGLGRDDVVDWTREIGANARDILLREVLRPAPTTDAWQTIARSHREEIAVGLDGLSLVEAAHPTEEASAIALMLREVLDAPGQTAALVTPDRNLARRVAAELGRWNITIDDSGGRPLAHTPPGAFLCLLADAAHAAFAPVPLLALLKHPLTACGMGTGEFRGFVRTLDRLCLRGPRPDPGLEGVAARIRRARPDAEHDGLIRWFDAVMRALSPLATAINEDEISLPSAISAHVNAAEALASTDNEEGAARLWRGEPGERAAALIAELSQASADLPGIDPGSYPALFRALADERAVRPTYGGHPRLAILGPLEARLQSFDLIVLGGLNESNWPACGGSGCMVVPADAREAGARATRTVDRAGGARFRDAGLGAACRAYARAQGRRRADCRLALVAASKAIGQRARICREPQKPHPLRLARANGRHARNARTAARAATAHAAGRQTAAQSFRHRD